MEHDEKDMKKRKNKSQPRDEEKRASSSFRGNMREDLFIVQYYKKVSFIYL